MPGLWLPTCSPGDPCRCLGLQGPRVSRSAPSLGGRQARIGPQPGQSRFLDGVSVLFTQKSGGDCPRGPLAARLRRPTSFARQAIDPYGFSDQNRQILRKKYDDPIKRDVLRGELRVWRRRSETWWWNGSMYQRQLFACKSKARIRFRIGWSSRPSAIARRTRRPPNQPERRSRRRR